MSTPSRKRPISTAVICALAGLCAPACAAEIDEGTETIDMEQQALAQIQVGDARVSFVEVAPGTLVTLSNNPSGQTSPLADPALRAMTPLQKYEYLAKRPAPEILRAAQERWNAIEREAPAAGAAREPEAASTEQEVAAGQPQEQPLVDKLLEAEFRARYCWAGIKKCLIYVTGDRQYEVWSKGMSGAVNPIQGSVRLQLRQRDASGWHNIPGGDVLVRENTTTTYEVAIARIIDRQFRATVYEAQYDIYNWAHNW